MKPLVHVLVLGGTITMLPQADGGIAPSVDGTALLKAVPGLSRLAEIVVSTPFLIPSASLSLAHLAEVASSCRQAFAAGAAGVVVVQGTDTIEETSFYLDLLHTGAEPIVVTGAMRGAGSPGADGDANLTAAVAVAASSAARDLGGLVVLNDEIHAARSVVKGHTALPSAFQSPGFGALGLVAENAIHLRLRPMSREHHLGTPTGDAASVAILKACLGDDGRLVDAALAGGYRGLVIEGMGAGHVPGSWTDSLSAAAAAVPVILATRVSGGPVFRNTYGFKGSEIDLIRCGLIPAGYLSAEKSRLLLALLLGAGRSSDEIATAFATYS